MTSFAGGALADWTNLRQDWRPRLTTRAPQTVWFTRRVLPLWPLGCHPLAWTVRNSLGAKVRVVRCTPECSRSRLRNGMRRITGADSSMRPPRRGHIASVDRTESTLGMLPIETICAVRLNRHRSGVDTFAAPLPTARLRPVSGFFGAYRCVRRMPSADPFVFSELAPESAGGAIGGSGRLVSHYPSLVPAAFPPDTAQSRAGPARSPGGAVQPLNASIRPILAANWRVRNAIGRRFAKMSVDISTPIRRISRLAMRARRTNRVVSTPWTTRNSVNSFGGAT